jgi:hypothetical protein
MKKIILLALLTISLDGMAQYRLGITKHDLKKEFPNIILGDERQDTLVYYRESNSGLIIYYLKDNVSFMTAFFPTNNILLKEFIKEYDLKYIKATPNSWEQYLPEGIVLCSLHQGDDKKWFFLFQIKQ